MSAVITHRTNDITSINASDQRILQAARRLFIDRGLAGVNMDLIATEAKVARQTIYNRFENKEAVFHAALELHWAKFGTAVLSRLDASRPPAEVLDDIASDIVAFIENDEQVAMKRMIIAESRTLPGLAQRFFEVGSKPLLESFVQYLSDATAVGKLACANPIIAARQFIGMLQESLLWPQILGFERLSNDKRDEVIASAICVFLRAYAQRAND